MSEEQIPDRKEATEILVWWCKQNPLSAGAMVVLGLATGGVGLVVFPLLWLAVWSGYNMEKEGSAVQQYRNREQ